MARGKLDQKVVASVRETMQDRFGEIIRFFLEDSADHLDAIRSGCEKNDAVAVVLPAHTLQASSRQMGAVDLSDMAMKMELAARDSSAKGDNGTEHLIPLLGPLAEAFEGARVAMTDLLDESG